MNVVGPKHGCPRQTSVGGHCSIIYFKSARDHIHALGTVCEVLRRSVMPPTSKMSTESHMPEHNKGH